jgi:hypothetical protein
MKKLMILLVCATFFYEVRGDEGMWPLPLLVQRMERMRELGLKLQDYDIYNPDGSSIKDAVISFGGGCTGEIISSQGLVLTNHHCGYSQIQSHSALEHDYLTDGFWAFSLEDELPCPGLTVTFIEKIEDVTDYVMVALAKDYGRYSPDGNRMPVCFTATTHSTGGNSGSPVINAKGELIGINFDRNWEGVGGDIQYLPDYQRSIIVDIRYVLFVIDKYAGARYLLREMDIN